jgi:hypothetical protein
LIGVAGDRLFQTLDDCDGDIGRIKVDALGRIGSSQRLILEDDKQVKSTRWVGAHLVPNLCPDSLATKSSRANRLQRPDLPTPRAADGERTDIVGAQTIFNVQFHKKKYIPHQFRSHRDQIRLLGPAPPQPKPLRPSPQNAPALQTPGAPRPR